MARFLTELRTEVLETRDLLKLAGMILVPMALIAKEPDLGTALTYVPILAIGVFLAGLHWKYWVIDRWWWCWWRCPWRILIWNHTSETGL